MSFRVTFRSTYDSMSSVLMNYNKELAALNYQNATGNKVNYPSDDPVAMVGILSSRQQLAALAQYEANINMAESWLNNSESALDSISDIMARAGELAEQMATTTYSATNRTATAEEIEGLISNMVALLNTKVTDSYIFAGDKTSAPPFSESLHVGSALADSANTGDYSGVISSGGAYYQGHAKVSAGFSGLGHYEYLADQVEADKDAALDYTGYFSFYYDADGDYSGANSEVSDIFGFTEISAGMSLEDIQDLINQGTAARGTLTFDVSTASNDYITIGNTTYEFVNSAGAAGTLSGAVLVSMGAAAASAGLVMSALLKTMNAFGSADTWAVQSAGDTDSITLFAKSNGTGGNSLTVYTNTDLGTWSTADGAFADISAAALNFAGGGGQWVRAEVVSTASGYQLKLIGEGSNASVSTGYQIYLGSAGGPLPLISGATLSFFSENYDQAGEWNVGNSPLLYLFADNEGSAYNSMSVTFVSPATADAELAVAVADNAITVTLGTDSAGNLESTLGEVIRALAANPTTADLIDAELVDGVDSNLIVQPTATTYFSNGQTATSRRYVIEITRSGAVGGARAASLTTTLSGAGNDLVITALSAGSGGNNTSIRYVMGASGASTTTVAVGSSYDITVTLAVDDEGSNILATAAQVLSALNAGASALITASLAAGNTGSGTMTELNWAVLNGGAEQAEFRVFEYVNGVLTSGGSTFLANSGLTQIFDTNNSEYWGVQVSFTENGTTLEANDTYYIDASYYRGNETVLETTIGTGSDTIQKNVTGTDVIGGAGDSDNLLDLLRQLKTALLSNDVDGIGELIPLISEAEESIVADEATVGARINRLEMTLTINTNFALTAEAYLEDTESADMSELLLKLNMMETAYEASLTSIARVTALSLIDYL